MWVGLWDVDKDSLAAAQPLEYLATTWGPNEHALLECEAGSPDGQARWEAYSALLAVAVWAEHARDPRARVFLVGDALGVLRASVSLHSRDAVINRICAEMALILAPSGAELGALHWWSEENKSADALSRLALGTPLPACCRHITRQKVDRMTWGFLGR